MRVTHQSFYSNFYGDSFRRHFRRIPDFIHSKIFKQYIVLSPKQLYRHVNKNSGFYPCFISVYDYGSVNNLKGKKKDNLIFDRIFFDFDTKDSEAERLKTMLIALRKEGPHYKREKQADLKEQLKGRVINNEIPKNAVDDAKIFSKIFKRDFGKEPALFFSGFKGCHTYVFFEPFEPKEINRTVHHFAENVKKSYGLDSMDLSVNKDAMSRVSRIPYSKHQLTDLTVVPFETSDNYNEIVRRAEDPKIQSFNVENHLIDFNIHLKKIDEILSQYVAIKPKTKSNIRFNSQPSKFKTYDNRLLFKQTIGEPVKEYEHYNMHQCPFPDHEDSKPSFMVHSKGYNCYGCNRKGNYWQFLKDYNGWDDDQVRMHLKSTQT